MGCAFVSVLDETNLRFITGEMISQKYAIVSMGRTAISLKNGRYRSRMQNRKNWMPVCMIWS